MGFIPISVRSKIEYITSLLALKNIVSGVLGTRDEVMKQGGISLSDCGFILPSNLIDLKVSPLHFQLDYGVLPKLHLSLV